MTAIKEPIGCVKEVSRLIGDRWTPQLLRAFFNSQTLRFCQIETLVEGINPRTLSARLDTLEQEGLIEKQVKGDSSRCEYCLTEKGASLEPILRSMSSWAAQTH